MFVPITSQNGLRNSFNQQAYREAIISLLTRRRMPFSAVEWSEMKDLALACNPAIEDLLISSRRTAVRYIASNYRLYRGQIKEGLAASISPIHIEADQIPHMVLEAALDLYESSGRTMNTRLHRLASRAATP